ncbi:hypothetical protein [Pseudescherichia vulneris]|uniref:DUF968 domain-containing protein n=1 Tax=Pseudescherichia vulneris TaxID=566 RepID=UPI003017F45B
MTHELQKALLQDQNTNNSRNATLTRHVRVFTLPESAVQQLLRMTVAAPIKAVYRKNVLEVNPLDSPAIIAAAEEAPIVAIAVDADAPAQHMCRPKIPRWECQAYTD